MSRIDLKSFGGGGGGGRLPNGSNFDDFNFGILPDDDDFDGEQLEDNIDAVNDETFGVDVDSGVMDDDLEQYSKQTAGLHLDDDDGETTRWFDEPTCSISAPDPSELPVPPFGFDLFHPSAANASSSSSFCDNFNSFKMQLGTTDSLWKNVDAAASLAWSEPELSVLQKSAFNFAQSKASENGTGLLENYNFLSSGNGPTENDTIRTMASVPKGAIVTYEQIEKNHVYSKAVKPTVSTIPPLPSEGAVTLAELEKRLLLESANRAAAAALSAPTVDRPATVLPTEPLQRVPQLLNPPPPPHPPPPIPPLPYLPFPMLPPVVMQIIRAHVLGQLPELPPGFPPVTPQMRAAVLSLGPPPLPPRMPSHAMPPPPFPFMQQPSPNRPTRPPLPPHLLYPPQAHIHPQMPPGVIHHTRSGGYNRDRLGRRAGLPSSKTISDFALSPFAGFVSKKEREWLIKIQQLQCQGCGNLYEDDFYYTTWKQRKLAMERRKKGLKAEDEECDYSMSITNPHHYVPPTFAGSLGKPTLSTVNYPRHLIDLTGDSPDDDDRLSMKSNASQKKLRALLLQLENIALLIIECDDRRRALCAPSLPDELQTELRDGIDSRLKVVIESICSNDRLQTVLLINKGRQMFARTLALADEQQKLYLLECFLAASVTVEKRVPVNEMNESLLVPIFEALSRLSKTALTDFVQNPKLTAAAAAAEGSKNLFMVNLLISLLVCCSRKDCRLDTYFCGTALRLLLQQCSQQTTLQHSTLDQYISLTSLTYADVKMLDSWSARYITGYRGSIAEELINNLQLTCKLHKPEIQE